MSDARRNSYARPRHEQLTARAAQGLPPNRPSETFAYRKLEPFTLGRLNALYENRAFVEAAVFDINAFGRGGVELGKELTTALRPVIECTASAEAHGASTAELACYLTGRSVVRQRKIEGHLPRRAFLPTKGR